MRLKDLMKKMDIVHKKIDLILEQKPSTEELNNEDFASKIINNLMSINHNNSFENEILSLASWQNYYWNSQNQTSFFNSLTNINNKIEKMKNLIEGTVVKDNKYNYIYAIKLPTYEYFEDLAEFTKNMNFIFNTVLQGDKKAKLAGFDVGSEWYLVAVEKIIEFNIFCSFINHVHRYLEMGLLSQKLKQESNTNITEEIDSEVNKKMLETIDLLNNKSAMICAKNICSDVGQERDVEDMTKLAKAVGEMAKIIKKGGEVVIDKEPLESEFGEGEVTKMVKSEIIKKLVDESANYLIESDDNKI